MSHTQNKNEKYLFIYGVKKELITWDRASNTHTSPILLMTCSIRQKKHWAINFWKCTLEHFHGMANLMLNQKNKQI